MNNADQEPSNKMSREPAPGTASSPDDGPPDAELVGRCQAGDMAAFDALVTRYRGKVYAMIFHLVRNDADAWDLAQDAFVRAWRAIDKFEARSSFYTWIFRIAHNGAYDFLRKKRPTGEEELGDLNQGRVAAGAKTLPKADAAPDDALSNAELGERITAALAELSEEHRSAIVLKEVQGLKYEEIAEVQGVSIGTVMSRLFYARKKLQGLLQDTYES